MRGRPGALALVVSLALTAACASAPPRPRLSPGTPTSIAAALLAMPAPDAAAEARITGSLMSATDEELLYLCAMIGNPGTDDDRLARYAVGALVASAGAPGHAEDRSRLEGLLGRAMLAAPESEPRNFFASQLQWIGAAASVPALAELLREPDTADAAIQALTVIGGELAVERLRQRLAEGAPEAAALSLALARLRDAAALAPVMALLAADDASVRLAALAAAAELAAADAAEVLVTAAGDFAGADRGRALAHLIRYAERLQSQGEKAVADDILRPLLHDDNPAVRQAAAGALEQ